MSHCFGNNRNLSAKEYIIDKGNNVKFCELRSKFISNSLNPTGTNIVCVNNNGVMVKYNSHNNLLNLKKALGNFRTDLYYFAGYGHQYKSDTCNNIPGPDNTDISNNYTSNVSFLTYPDDNNTAQDNIIDSLGNYNNKYAEIDTKQPEIFIDLDANSNFKNKKLKIYKRCTLRENRKESEFATIITPDDISEIVVTSIQIIFI